ncbi:MAG: hypothetical protein WC807_14620 [Hyphomicrobium sp.]|jgi:hypothetical protein
MAIYTEEEAKTKWCPETRTGLTAGMAVNHHVGGDVHEETRCIGSGCMMWRWKRGSVFHPAPPDPANPTVAHFTEIENRGDYSKTHGFCGKAGRP